MSLTPEEKRARARKAGHKYYQRNREAVLARQKTPEAKEKRKAWERANKEKMCEYGREDYQKHKIKRQSQMKLYRALNPRPKTYITGYMRRRKELAAGRPAPDHCEVCGDLTPRQQMHFDHCHQRGIFRGWLCQGCNKVLGFVRDDPNRLRKLIAYLERTKDLVPRQFSLPV